MARQNKATVKDEELGKAFAQGVNEGMRLVGYVTLFIEVGEKRFTRQPMVAIADVANTVAEILSSMKAEQFEAGVSIRILTEGEITAEEEAEQELPDGIEDAEVVEDSQ